MNDLLALSQLRYLLRHYRQTALVVLGIALGVAVVNAVDISNHSARQNLQRAVQPFKQLGDHRIIAASRYFDEQHYSTLRHQLLSVHPRLQLTPFIQGTVSQGTGQSAQADQPNWQILGLDPLGFSSSVASAQYNPRVDFSRLIQQPDSVLISSALATEQQLKPRDLLRINSHNGPQTVTIAGIIDSDQRHRLISDIGIAQRLLGRQGQLSFISVASPPDNATLNAVQNALPAGLTLIKTRELVSGQQSLIHALEFNLSALSLLAMVVGGFLIFSTLRFSMLQRRPLFARLRVQGVSNRQLRQRLLVEATLLALAGMILGWLAGFALSQWLIPLSHRTINDLYTGNIDSQTTLNSWLYLKTAAMALLITLASSQCSFAPLSKQPPTLSLSRIHQESEPSQRGQGHSLAGLILIVIGFILCWQTDNLSFSYMAALMIITGALLLIVVIIPSCYTPLMPLCQRLFGSIGLIAIRDCQRESSRVTLAIVALCVAVGATNGIAIMVDSFRHTVSQWLDTSLNADLYIRPASERQSIQPKQVDFLHSHPAIAAIEYRQFNRVFVDHKWLPLTALETKALQHRKSIVLVDNGLDQWLANFSQGQLLISQPLARKKQLQAGSKLTLLTPSGKRPFSIAGVFYDYGAEHGRIYIEQGHYQRIWGDTAIDSIELFLNNPRQKQPLLSQLEQTLTPEAGLQLVDSAIIKQQVLAVFDRTFAITQILQTLVLIIAVVAIVSTLMLYQLQRQTQLLTLRVLGVTVNELRKLFFIQAGFIGSCAGLLAIPLGLLMAWLLVFVINPAAFGWSLQFHVDPLICASGLLVSMLAGLLAAIYPSLHFGPSTHLVELNRE